MYAYISMLQPVKVNWSIRNVKYNGAEYQNHVREKPDL
jgi:hypothetical protein